MSKEGIGSILVMIAIAGILTVGAILTPFPHLTVSAVLGYLLLGLVVYFFRDPERQIPENEKAVISPADGKVIEIEQEYESDYLQEDAIRVSIFLSIFDVHVNRIPMSGSVAFFQYKRGSFLQAYKKEASDVNEQAIIGIEGDNTKILFKQIAGLIARRIVCHVRQGYEVTRGERFGIIKFGSRVDIFVPKDTELKVKLKDKVRGGESIIGVLNHESQNI